MGFPKANRATVLNIGKSLLAIELFYEKTCELMKEMLLPPPFSQDPDPSEEQPKPSFLFHTILDFVCNKITQILENDDLSLLSMEAVSEILSYFKDKQIKEYKSNLKITEKHSKQYLLEKLAQIELKFSNISDLSLENQKKTQYLQGVKRKSVNPDPGALKKVKNFELDEEKTEFFNVQLGNCDYLYDDFLTEADIRSQCVPLESISANLLRKCKDEAPSASLYLYNLPKNCGKSEILQLLQQVFPKDLGEVEVQILKGRLKGQGFLHLQTSEMAKRVKDTFFGFPLHGKPMILQFSKSEPRLIN